MKSVLALGSVFLAILVASVSPLSSQQSRQPYLPLAVVEITASDTELDAVVTELSAFASQRNLTVRRGDFPKQGGSVVNMEISFRSDSHFIINNFRRADTLTMVAYSHEEERAWRTTWN